jgi:adenosylcobinamide-GDP ribazoletransferase
LSGLRAAIEFLTILPAGRGTWEPARAVIWFPVVGIVLAAIVGASCAGLMDVLPPLLGATLIIALWVVITGALHLDGLADTADAAFAPVPRERRLKILSDVYHGTFAVVTVLLIVVIKIAALASLDARGAAAAVALAIVGGRGVLPLAIRAFPVARACGMGAATREGATISAVVIGLAITTLAALVLLGWAGLAVVAGLIAATLIVGSWLTGRFGGLTGDSYGAIIELIDAIALVAAMALVSNGYTTAFPWKGRL